MSKLKPVVLSADGKQHYPLPSGDTLDISGIKTDGSITGQGTEDDPLRVDQDWLRLFIKDTLCPDGCWNHTTQSGTEQVAPFRQGKYAVTIGTGFGIVDLTLCDEYTATVGSPSTFQLGTLTLTGDNNVPVKVNYIGNANNIGTVYDQDTIPPQDGSGWAAPADYNLAKYISPFSDMNKTPADTAMYCVGHLNIKAGDYILSTNGDDVCMVYIAGEFVVQGGGQGGWKKTALHVDKTGYLQVIVYDYNRPDNTPSWFQMTLLSADGSTVIHQFTKDDFTYSITTDLDCVS